jgi:hypothetical protein
MKQTLFTVLSRKFLYDFKKVQHISVNKVGKVFLLILTPRGACATAGINQWTAVQDDAVY